MEAMEAILTRRSIGKVKPDQVPAEIIEQILTAGIHAPNHHRTNPWRFFVMTGEGRNKLGKVLGDITQAENEGLPADELAVKVDKSSKNPLRAPVVIAVGVEPSDKGNVILAEEHAAVNSAVQNMLLAAHSFGLGTVWRTGNICYHKKVAEFFGLTEKGEILAFVYLGYPDMEPREVNKTDIESFTTWID